MALLGKNSTKIGCFNRKNAHTGAVPQRPRNLLQRADGLLLRLQNILRRVVLRLIKLPAVCCRVLQCVAVCCSVLLCGAVWCCVVLCVAVWCCVLLCVAV